MRKRNKIILSVLVGLAIISFVIFLIPAFRESISWHLNLWLIRARTWLKPPEDIAFSSDTETEPGSELLPSPNVENNALEEDKPLEIMPPTSASEEIPSTYEIARGE